MAILYDKQNGNELALLQKFLQKLNALCRVQGIRYCLLSPYLDVPTVEDAVRLSKTLSVALPVDSYERLASVCKVENSMALSWRSPDTILTYTSFDAVLVVDGQMGVPIYPIVPTGNPRDAARQMRCQKRYNSMLRRKRVKGIRLRKIWNILSLAPFSREGILRKDAKNRVKFKGKKKGERVFVYGYDHSTDVIRDAEAYKPMAYDDCDRLIHALGKYTGLRHKEPMFERPLYIWQEEAIGALAALDSLCQKHNIEYILLAGSALGAVRHGGMIPWDDDIDVGMTLPNLRRFESIVQSALSEPYLYMLPTMNKEYPRLFGKILCNGRHCIDVFPLVKTSGKKKLYDTHRWASKLVVSGYLYKMNAHFPLRKNRLSTPYRILRGKIKAKLNTRDQLLTQYQKVLNRYEEADVPYYLNICSIYASDREMFPVEWFKKIDRVPFAGGEYPILHNTDCYLYNIYGNYMKLPAISKRTPNHETQVFSTDM